MNSILTYAYGSASWEVAFEAGAVDLGQVPVTQDDGRKLLATLPACRARTCAKIYVMISKWNMKLAPAKNYGKEEVILHVTCET